MGKPMPETALWVEDNQSILSSFIPNLENAGFVIQGETNPDRAFEIFQKKQFDFILLDLKFENSPTNGADLFIKIRKIDQNIPIFAITSHSDDDQYPEFNFLCRMADGVKQKPLPTPKASKKEFDEMIGDFRRAVDSNLKYRFRKSEEIIYRTALELLELWIGKHSSPNDKRYFVSGNLISANDLYQEIKCGTILGNGYLTSLVNIGLRQMLYTMKKSDKET